ncbi:MAG: alpha-keto acid decarboxylase family protein, partial [Chloroflexi bacterium]
MSNNCTIGEYLINRLRALGVEHIFGIPGDYVLGFYKALEDSPLQLINTGDEQGAGFAADAYARLRGLGVVVVTYTVGGLKVANTTAQAYAEKSPVVVISGAPGVEERVRRPLLHHKVKQYNSQYKIFQELTTAATVLDNPETAAREIDRVLHAALSRKRPVYIELPRDMVSKPCPNPTANPLPKVKSNPDALREALKEAVEAINAARQPVILAGVELHRFGLQDELIRFFEKTNIPLASTILGKSIVNEHRSHYLGVYEGALGQTDVTEYVESSDCLLMLGAFMTDVNLGIYTAHLDQGRSISVTSEKTSIRYHTYENIRLKDFLHGLLEADIRPRELGNIPRPPAPQEFQPTDQPITVKRLFQRLNSFLEDNTVVMTDTGDAMFGALDLAVHGRTKYLSPAYYTSLGFAVPGSIGAQAANPNLRPLVIVGDGAFQMTGMELATAVRYGMNPIVVVLNNAGYGTERPMLDGEFNDVSDWQFHKLPE